LETAAAQFERGRQWLSSRWRTALRVVAAGIFFLLLLLRVLPWLVNGVWDFYMQRKEALTPLLAPLGTFLVGIGTVAVGIGTIRVSGRQARIAAQGAVNTAFYNAVSRLASDKIEERLGGIYMLERISQQSADDYWTVMETLTAFVRERARWKGPDVGALETEVWFFEGNKTNPGKPPTDIAAVLAVILRRGEDNEKREAQKSWRFDLRGVDLRGAYLRKAHLKGADLTEAHLERADLVGAHVEGAHLIEAHLEHVDLTEAHLEGAHLIGANLEDATLGKARLERADLVGARLQRANLRRAHLESALLSRAHLQDAYLMEAHLQGAELGGIFGDANGLTQAQIDAAIGDAKTQLPRELSRPAHWPASGGGGIGGR
jgi:uncharacterized protein YjbI with pentapeptide repeats